MDSMDGGPAPVPDEKLFIVADSKMSHSSESQSAWISQCTLFRHEIWDRDFILLKGKLNRRMICKIQTTGDGDCKKGHILLNDLVRKNLQVSVGDTVSYEHPITIKCGAATIYVSPKDQDIAAEDLLDEYIIPFFKRENFVVHENNIFNAPSIKGRRRSEFEIIRTHPSPFCKVGPGTKFIVEYANEVNVNVQVSIGYNRVGDTSKSQKPEKRNDIPLNNQICLLEAECSALSLPLPAFVLMTKLSSSCPAPKKMKVAAEQQDKVIMTDLNLRLDESNPISAFSQTIASPPPASPPPASPPPPQIPRPVTIITMRKPKLIHILEPLSNSDSHTVFGKKYVGNIPATIQSTRNVIDGQPLGLNIRNNETSISPIASSSKYFLEKIPRVKMESDEEPGEANPIRVSPVPVPVPVAGVQEPSQSGPAGHGAEWLRQDVFRRTPYFPQMGDDLIYLREGHQLYEEATVSEENIVTELPPPQIKEDLPYVKFPDLKAAESVTVIGVEFHISNSNNNTRFVQLKLALTDWNTRERTCCAQVFTVKYKYMDRISDFLVLKQIYDHALQHNWNETDKLRFMDPFKNSWLVGTIVKKNVHSTKFPESHFHSYEVQLDGTECLRYLSPWNMEKIPQDFQYEIPGNPYDGLPASEMDVNLATNDIYKVSVEDWPAQGQEIECKRISEVISHLIPLPLSQDFHKKYQEHSKKVAYPVDLHLIRARLDNLFYRRPAALKTDIESISISAGKLFGHGTVPYKIANLISELLKRIVGDPKYRRLTYEIYSQYAPPTSNKLECQTKGKTGTMEVAPSSVSTERDYLRPTSRMPPGARNKPYRTRSVANPNWKKNCC